MKKRPAKPSEPVSDPKPKAKPEKAPTGILYTAPGIPAGLSPTGFIPKGETDWRRFHEINVRGATHLGPPFVLYNRSEVCGTRLIRGVGFPLETSNDLQRIEVAMSLFCYATLDEAKAAADLLQDYLDNYENKHLEVARKRYEKENALITA